MATQVTVKWNGDDLPIDMSREDLSIKEAITVEKLSGVPFFSARPGPQPVPVWAAQLLVQIRRHDPEAKLADVEQLPMSAVVVRQVVDEQPLTGAGSDDGGEPDPTDGEGSDTAPSPTAETTTSGSSPST